MYCRSTSVSSFPSSFSPSYAISRNHTGERDGVSSGGGGPGRNERAYSGVCEGRLTRLTPGRGQVKEKEEEHLMNEGKVPVAGA